MTLTCGDVTFECPAEPQGDGPVGELQGTVRVGDSPAVAVVFVTARQYARQVVTALHALRTGDFLVASADAPAAVPVLVPEVTRTAIEDLIRRRAFEPFLSAAQPLGVSCPPQPPS